MKGGGLEIGDQKSIKQEMERSKKKVQRRRCWRDDSAIQRTQMSIRGDSQPVTLVLGPTFWPPWTLKTHGAQNM